MPEKNYFNIDYVSVDIEKEYNKKWLNIGYRLDHKLFLRQSGYFDNLLLISKQINDIERETFVW